MDAPEEFPYRELADWLKYYRALGFTHLYRSSPPSHRNEIASQPAAPVERAELRAAQESARPMSAAAPKSSSEPARRVAAAAPPAFPSPAHAVSAASLFDRVAPRETLEQIREDLGDCRRCKLAGGRKTIVFGSGNPQAELLFVGEGPGADEDAQGLPFVGRAGQLLTQMIEKGMKIPRPDVYICNIIKCRPPENRKPERDEIAACRPFVERQVDAVRPRVIVALGATAVEALLGTNQSMGKLRGQWHEFRGIPLMVTYHPAFLLRDPNRKPDAWEDLKKVLAFLKSSPPRPASG